MRPKEVLEYVLSNEGISYSDLAKLMGIPRAQPLYDIRDGKIKNISENYANKILAVFPKYNKGWLMSGEGEILKEAAQPIQVPKASHDEVHRVIYYPNVDGSMGGVFFTDNPDEARQDIIIPGFSDCQYAINAYGDSMSPLIKSGQIVLLSEWHERFIEWGKIYLVITASGYRTIKRLFPGKDEAHITCKSENAAESPAFEIDASDVVKVYLVKGWICRDAI